MALGTVASIGMAVASVGMQAAGAYSQAKAKKGAAKYNRDVALTNAQIADDNMRDTELRGRQAVFDQRRAVVREMASVRAASAGAGLTVGEAGTTPQDLVQSMVEAGELDVMRLRNNIENEKRRAAIEGTSFRAQAGAFEAERRSISPLRSAVISGGGAVMSNKDVLFGSLGGGD